MFDFDVRSGNSPEADAPQGDQHLGRDYLYPILPDAGGRRPCEDPVSIELSEPISQLPRRAPLVVAPACTLQDAFRLMAEREASAALVASHGVLLGMLTERDVVRRLLKPETAVADLPVWKVMSPQPETLLDSDTVGYAVRKIWALGGRAMPILGPGGALFGLLETADLMAWMCGRVGATPHTFADQE